jgi:hypothetical protein
MSKPGDPGQAGSYNPKKGGKFAPTTKAHPPDNPHEGHGHKGKNEPHAEAPDKPGHPSRPRPRPHK